MNTSTNTAPTNHDFADDRDVSCSPVDGDSSMTFHNPAPFASPSIVGGESKVSFVTCDD